MPNYPHMDPVGMHLNYGCALTHIQAGVADCDRRNTFFRHDYEYEYTYVATTSNSFTGTTDSRAGSWLTCTIHLQVPAKCELVLQLSRCELEELGVGDSGEEKYFPVKGTAPFIQELQRSAVYFQMNKGIIIQDSVKMDEHDTLTVKNIKRAIVSALQLQIHEPEVYINPLQQLDIFGTCPTAYSMVAEGGKTIRTYRNLCECSLPQVYKNNFDSFFNVAKRLKVGERYRPIDEGIYPYVSDVTCDHVLSPQKRMKRVTCFQNQYFTPMANHDEILATAMTNISQVLELQSTKRNKNLPSPVTTDKVVTDIRFDMGTEPVINDKSELLTQIEAVANALANEFKKTPELAGSLIMMFRKSTPMALMDTMTDVFSTCPALCEPSKLLRQQAYLDAAVSCGTDACVEAVLHCISMKHMGRVHSTLYLYQMALSHSLPDTTLNKMLTLCKSRDKTSCWLPLAMLIGKQEIDPNSNLEVESAAWQVLTHMRQLIGDQCQTGVLVSTERDLITVIKAFANVGMPMLKKFDDGNSEAGKILPLLETCVRTGGLTTQVMKAVLMTMQSLKSPGDVLPATTKDALYAMFTDKSRDMLLRSLAFSSLLHDNNIETARLLLQHASGVSIKDNDQMVAYMKSSIQTLLENDQPDLQGLRTMWNKALAGSDYYVGSGKERFQLGFSKQINVANFFKLPLTEYMGMQLFLDIVYDPSAVLYRTFTMSINYFHGDKKYNVIELSTDVHGFDALLGVVTGKSGKKMMDLFAEYKGQKAAAADGEGHEAEGEGHHAEGHHHHAEGHEGDLFTNFQEDIIDAVTKMIKQANYPQQPNFDFVIHIKAKGQNMHFWSFSEMIQKMRGVKEQADPAQPSMMDQAMLMLLYGVQKNPVRIAEVLSIEKDLPTVAGLPLNITVQVVAAHSLKVGVQADIITYVSGAGPLTAGLDLDYQYGLVFSADVRVPVYGYHDSGHGAKVTVGIEHGRGIDIAFSQKTPTAEIPKSRKLEIGLRNIGKNRELENLFQVKGEMYLVHYSKPRTVLPRDPAVDESHEKCRGENMVKVTGRKICLQAYYPNTASSNRHPKFPLSGPFEVKLVYTKDDKSFDRRSVTVEYELHNTSGILESKGSVLHLAQGDVYERRVAGAWTYNWKTHNFYMDFAIPELGIVYDGKVEKFHNRVTGSRQFAWVDFLSQNGQPLFGYFLKGSSATRTRPDGVQAQMRTANFNISSSGISLDVNVEYEKVPDNQGRMFHLIVSYYCDPGRKPILSQLHINKELAVQHGNTTTIDFTYKMDWHSLGGGERRKDRSATLDYFGRAFSLDDSITSYPGGGHRDVSVTYMFAGIEKTVSFSGDLVNKSTEQNMDLVVTGTYNGAVGNTAVIDASVTGNPMDMKVSWRAHYKDGDPNASRAKRSLSSIYKKFEELEELAVAEMSKVKDVILGVGKKAAPKEDVVVPEETPVQSKPQLPELPPLPDYPSIFEIEEWTAEVVFTSKAQLVDQGMEFHWTLDLTYPWNGGYKVNQITGKTGRNMQNTMSNFKFWSEAQGTLTLTNLDGQPASPDSVPGGIVVYPRSAGFHLEGLARHLFDFSLHFQSLILNKTVQIKIDGDSDSLDRPIVLFSSHQKSLIFPFFDHDYDETISYADKHGVHSMDLVHQCFEAHVQTDVYIWHPTENTKATQTGTVQVRLPTYQGGFAFDIELVPAGDKRLPPVMTVGVIYDSSPEKSRIVRFSIPKPAALLIERSVKMPPTAAEAVDQFSLLVEMHGSSTVQATFHWTPAFDPVMTSRKYFPPGFLVGRKLLGMSATVYSNVGKGWMERQVPFTGKTRAEMIKSHVLPKVIMAARNMKAASLNFVRRENRDQVFGDSAVPSRLIGFLMAAKARREMDKAAGPSWSQRFMRIRAYLLKRVGQLILMQTAKISKGPEMQKVLQDREIVSAFPVPFIVSKRLSVRMKEGMKNVLSSVLLRLKYQKAKSMKPPMPQEKTAIIFGRHADSRTLNIQTFDKSYFHIPASSAESCSYLLVADIAHKHYALVSTPEGISLLTKDYSVSVDFSNHVFINKCKKPLSMDADSVASPSGDVTVDIHDETINIQTKYGVSVTCLKEANDICLVTLGRSHRNHTLGLLGTSDDDEQTDNRMLDGSWAPTKADLLSEYVVAGPQSCRAHPAQIGLEDVCNEELHSYCFKYFNAPTLPGVTMCSAVISSSPFMSVCRRESQKCDGSPQDACHAVSAYNSMCKLAGLADKPEDHPHAVPCHHVIHDDHEDHQEGALDVVFVVSEHRNMRGKKEPWELVQTLLNVRGARLQFSSVRMGVIGFGGVSNQGAPYSIMQEDKYFASQQEMDWTKLHPLSASGSTNSDAFDAIELATSYPYNPNSHKLIIVMMEKEEKEGGGVSANLDRVREKLTSKDITLNVFNSYTKKVFTKKMLGADYQGNIISRKEGLTKKVNLPTDDYTKLVVATRGAMLKISTLFDGRVLRINRILQHFVQQVTDHNAGTCPSD